MNILFFGDSLTAGYGLRTPGADSYPAIIGQKIREAGLKYQVINAGISGDTTAGGLNRLGYWTSQPIEVFVLELGVNDIFRGIPPQVVQQNLQAIVSKVRGMYPHVKLVMMGMEFPMFDQFKFALAYRPVFRTVALANNMELVPFFLEGVAGKVHMNLQDGLHPTAEGYKVIAEHVWPFIKKIL